MTRPATIISPFLKHNLVTLLLIGASIAAFATLGDGGKRSTSVRSRNLLSLRTPVTDYKHFSLKSGYNYRGSSILNSASTEKVVLLNTVMTYQRGNATYFLPLKKKLLLGGKVTFTPQAPQR